MQSRFFAKNNSCASLRSPNANLRGMHAHRRLPRKASIQKRTMTYGQYFRIRAQLERTGFHFQLSLPGVQATNHFSRPRAIFRQRIVHPMLEWLRSRTQRLNGRCLGTASVLSARRWNRHTYELGFMKRQVSCLSWKWRKRSSVKIMERTYEERAQAPHC